LRDLPWDLLNLIMNLAGRDFLKTLKLVDR
jgi:hypothetical protein